MEKRQRFRQQSTAPDAPIPEPGLNSTVDDYIRGLKGSDHFRDRLVHLSRKPGRPPKWADERFPVSTPLKASLEAQGIPRLYAHQSEAVAQIRAHRHVVISTPTASGKTWIYTLPLLERIAEDPGGCMLYLSPLKALAQDQLRKLGDAAASVPHPDFRAAIYDGDTPATVRRKIRELPPNVLLSNPEMLHLSFLAHHGKWASFFRRLAMVVVDEVHTYRGVMGAHMAQVFRRLHRVCERYGSRPVYVFTSATVGNPGQLARQLTGLSVSVVDKSDAGSGDRYTVMIDASEGAAQAAILLLKAALHRGLKTIVYTRSRKMAELIAVWAKEKAGPFSDRIAAYRAGLLPGERRSIEAKLSDGRLLAVVSTSALESGIDIGGLDLCVLVGYPGSIVATRQRAGRVGRGGQPSAVILLAGEDALDQYLLRHPETVTEHPPEPAVVNPENPDILRRHLVCAAAEMPLDRDEPWLEAPVVREAAEQLTAGGDLLRSADGRTLTARRKAPHRKVDLRGAGNRYTIVASETGQVLGDIDEPRAFRETHPAAVYLHGGNTYRVRKLDIEARRVTVAPDSAEDYTRALSDKEIEIIEAVGQRRVGGCRMVVGRLKVTDQVTGYETRHIRTGRRLNRVTLDLPPVVFETEGIWVRPDDAALEAVAAAGGDVIGALHAAEHGMIGIFPLVVMADRDDLGGLATPFHPALGGAVIFIYDGIAGGAGLCRAAFHRAEALFAHTRNGIFSCSCNNGCPACIQSAKCGSGNRPLDKSGAILLLQHLMEVPLSDAVEIPSAAVEIPAKRPGRRGRSGPTRQSERFAVLDIETRRSAAEVGGWGRADRMGVSCAVLYDAAEDRYFDHFEEDLPVLFDRLDRADPVVGFNVKRFDYRVLSAYTDRDLSAIRTVDLLDDVYRVLGFRLSLDHLAEATLGRKKTAHGLQALEWWKEGNLEALVAYCRSDVEITRDLYRFGRDQGFLLFDDRQGRRMRVPVRW